MTTPAVSAALDQLGAAIEAMTSVGRTGARIGLAAGMEQAHPRLRPVLVVLLDLLDRVDAARLDRMVSALEVIGTWACRILAQRAAEVAEINPEAADAWLALGHLAALVERSTVEV